MSEDEYTVEKGVPLPRPHHKHAGLYPFAEMEVGDSFASPTETAVTCAYTYGRRHQKKFTSRRVNGGYRIWRVE